jgi:hypothetical protein
MRDKSAIVAIDVGKIGAYTVYDIENKTYIKERELSFDSSMVEIYIRFSQVIEELHENGYGSVVFIVGEAFGQRVVVKKHSKFYGVIELVCEKEKIELRYVSDSTCRAVVLGIGFGRNKPAVHEKYRCATPDISDCHLFTDWFLIQINEIDNSSNRKGA